MEAQALYSSPYSEAVTVVPSVTSRSGEPAYVRTIALALGPSNSFSSSFLADSGHMFLHAFINTGDDTVLRRFLYIFAAGSYRRLCPQG